MKGKVGNMHYNTEAMIHTIAKCKAKGKSDWKLIQRVLKEEHGLLRTTGSIRSVETRHKQQVVDLIKKIQSENIVEVEIVNQDVKPLLLEQLQKDATIDQLCSVSKLSQLEVLGHIEELRLLGYDIKQIRYGDVIVYTTNKETTTTFHEFRHYHDVEKVIRIGLISDTHIASRYWQKTYLQMAYHDFKKEGITRVYHCGDITDGMYTNRAGNIYEIYAYGFDEQKDEVVNNYPHEEGIDTYFITGNHDATHMMNGGANIGFAIEKERKDMHYLGHEFAKIWLTEKIDLDLVHPRDGTSYALSYKIQKRIDAMSGGSKPKIMAVGHYHKNFTMFYRNIHALSMASFQAQSPFLRGQGLVSDVGYTILEIKANANGDIIELNTRYKPLYETIKEQY